LRAIMLVLLAIQTALLISIFVRLGAALGAITDAIDAAILGQPEELLGRRRLALAVRRASKPPAGMHGVAKPGGELLGADP
jgi:hypothetical protein